MGLITSPIFEEPKFPEREKIPYEDLMANINQLAVWYQLIGIGDLRTRFRSPFRDDKNPNCYLLEVDGNVKFCDPTQIGKNKFRSLFDMIQHLNPTYTTGKIMEEIRRLGQIKTVPKDVNHAFDLRKRLDQASLPSFEAYKFCDWTEHHMDFWAQHGVRREQLDRLTTLVKPIRGYTVSNAKGFRSVEAFGFTYFIGNEIKRYCPFADKGFAKFGGRVSPDNFWHLRRDSNVLLISKSNKDLLVWENFCKADICCFGSENTVPSDSKLITLLRRYDKIVICFDPDDAGIRSSVFVSEKIKDLTGKTPLIKNWPCKESKDIAKYRQLHGHKATLLFIKNNL